MVMLWSAIHETGFISNSIQTTLSPPSFLKKNIKNKWKWKKYYIFFKKKVYMLAVGCKVMAVSYVPWVLFHLDTEAKCFVIYCHLIVTKVFLRVRFGVTCYRRLWLGFVIKIDCIFDKCRVIFLQHTSWFSQNECNSFLWLGFRNNHNCKSGYSASVWFYKHLLQWFK